VERAFSAPTEAEQDQLYLVVADLATYPSWLGLVHEVAPAGPEPADRGPGGDGSDGGHGGEGGHQPAWNVTLRARIGPLARSKRLRMVRTVADGRLVRFERREVDGRQHSSWVLAAEVGPRLDAPWRSEVTVELRYGGSLWSGLLDGVLQAAAVDATARLQAHLSADAP
jgi:hypothetical protein